METGTVVIEESTVIEETKAEATDSLPHVGAEPDEAAATSDTPLADAAAPGEGAPSGDPAPTEIAGNNDEGKPAGEPDQASPAPAPVADRPRSSWFDRQVAAQEKVQRQTIEVGNATAALYRAKQQAKDLAKRLEGELEQLEKVIAELHECENENAAPTLFDLPSSPAAPKAQAPAPALTTPEPWRSVPLVDVLGAVATDKLKASLEKANLLTLGEFADFSASTRRLTDLDGVGPATAEKINDAAADWWAKHPEMMPESKPATIEAPAPVDATPAPVTVEAYIASLDGPRHAYAEAAYDYLCADEADKGEDPDAAEPQAVNAEDRAEIRATIGRYISTIKGTSLDDERDERPEAVKDFVTHIEALLSSERFEFASDTLSGIAETVTKTQRVTRRQREAIDNIENSVAATI